MIKSVEIKDIFDIEKGSLQSSKNVPGEYDFITAGSDWKTHNEFSHDCEALIFAMAASGSLGRTHYVNGKFISSDLCFILTPKMSYADKLDLRFYYYYFNSIREQIVKATATGTTKLSINQTNFSNYTITYVDFDTQQKLKAVFEKVDIYSLELNRKLEKQQKYIMKLRQSILQQAIKGKLVTQDESDEPTAVLLKKVQEEKDKLTKEGKIKKGIPLSPVLEKEKSFELPNGWKWIRLGEVANIASNLVSPEIYKTMKHIAPDNIEKKTGKLLKCRTVVEDEVKSANHLFYTGQIIYSKIRPALSKIVIAPFDGLCSADMYPIDVFINKKYFVYVVLSEYFTSKVTENDNRVKMPKTNQNQLVKVPIPLPPLAEQQRIVDKVDMLMDYCEHLENNVNEAKIYSQKLMQAILNKAFSNNKSLNNIIEFPAADIYIEDYDIAARAESISPGTQKQIAERLKELRSKK